MLFLRTPFSEKIIYEPWPIDPVDPKSIQPQHTETVTSPNNEIIISDTASLISYDFDSNSMGNDVNTN
jgi:hypothetical protein